MRLHDLQCLLDEVTQIQLFPLAVVDRIANVVYKEEDLDTNAL